MHVHWGNALLPDIPLLEIIVRGSITYLAIFALLRLVRRQSSDLGISDLLVLVLVADAAQNAMAGTYTSVSDGIVLVGTIAFWSYALDWLAFRVPGVERLVHPPPLLLVADGQPLWRNMRKELVTEAELRAQLREQGIEDFSSVKRASLEADGKISVVSANGEQHQTKETGIH